MTTYNVARNSSDVSILVAMQDVNGGTIATGITYDFPVNIVCTTTGGTTTTHAAVNLPLATTAHTDWGWREVGYGTYRLDLPDSIFTTSHPRINIYCSDDTGGGPSSVSTLTIIELDNGVTKFTGEASRDVKAR